MRLHRLEVTAFGPFAGTETVDFDALTESGLFLLRGPTGAGKTSVLDAVCFALYGSVPGTRQRGGALRSDHARPELLTRVVLELTLAGRRLRITRQPEQRRPKQRGEGTTLVRPQTLLEEWEPAAGSWSARSGSHQEIGQELHDLVGMSRDQFCQVVLLPQGEFARFLHAPAQERRELLGRLFDTRRFTGAERWLQERTRLSERGVRDAEAELDAFTHRLDQAAGELTDAVPPLADRAAWAAQLRCEARERAGVAESAEALREEARRAAEERSAAAARLAERQQAYARAVAEQQRLADGQTAELARGVRLALNRRAESVAPLARLAARAEAESAAAGREAAALHAVLPEPERALTAEELVARERELRGEAGRLEALAETEAALHAEAAEADRLERQREEVERQHRAAAAWLAEVWPERQAKAQAALAEARAEAGAVEHLAEERDRARSRVRAAEERDALDAEAARSRAAATAARDEEQRLRDVWLDLKERRLAGMAAELASQLVAGKPCAVCGGTEHPAPAQAAGEAVTPEAEQTAEAAYLAARERTEAAQAALSGVEQRLAAARAEAGPQPAEELRSRAAELDARHREAEHQAVAAVRAEEELALLEQQHERHLAAASRAANSLAVLEEQLDQLARRQTAGQARLEEARAGAASVADRVRTVTALADSCAAAAEAERSASALAAQAADATAEALQAARTHGFETLADAAAALLEPEQARQLEQESARYKEDTARVRLVLEDAALAADAALPPAAPDAARADLDAADAALRSAAVRARAARQRCADLDALSAELASRAAQLTPLLEEHAELAELAALVAGTGRSNRRRMSLENYVLAARLESVAASAGARLAVMSGGRYTLVHSDALAKGNARSGLGLKVVDAWTGQERDTATLSGGESFFASLALALGLADVVTDEAGGVPLDTLFIDEGFGSLDAETLEDVLNVLDSLRERDRAVGIVSHVTDLRDRIPNQLEVRKTRTGSTLRRVLA